MNKSLVYLSPVPLGTLSRSRYRVTFCVARNLPRTVNGTDAETTDARVDRILRLPNGACWTVLAYWREAA